MFIVTPKDVLDLADTLKTLTQYNVNSRMMKINDDLVVVVHSEGEPHALRLCEMAFQMNFHQKNDKACLFCANKGEEFCGHLTFTRRIG